jgi:hypothetical protein
MVLSREMCLGIFAGVLLSEALRLGIESWQPARDVLRFQAG